MSQLLQTLALLSRPLGTLIYHLGLCLLVAATVGLAVRAGRDARRAAAPEAAAWVALAAALLLLGGFQVAALVLAASPWAPPTERAASTLALGVMLLALAAPLARRITVVVSGLLGAAVLAGLAASLVLWPAGAPGTPFYNDSLPDLLWLVAQVSLLVIGLVALAVRHRPGWLAGVGLLAILFTGQALHYAFPLGNLDGPVTVRLAELLAWPLLLVMVAVRTRAAAKPMTLPAVVARSLTLPEPARVSTPGLWSTAVASNTAGETPLMAGAEAPVQAPSLPFAPAADDLTLVGAAHVQSEPSEKVATAVEADAASPPLTDFATEETLRSEPVSTGAAAPAANLAEFGEPGHLSEDTQPIPSVQAHALPKAPAPEPDFEAMERLRQARQSSQAEDQRLAEQLDAALAQIQDQAQRDQQHALSLEAAQRSRQQLREVFRASHRRLRAMTHDLHQAQTRTAQMAQAQAELEATVARLEGERGDTQAKAGQTAATLAARRAEAAQQRDTTRQAEGKALALQAQNTELQAALEAARAEAQASQPARLTAAALALAQAQTHSAATASLQQRLEALERQEALLQQAYRQSQGQLQTVSAELKSRQAQAAEHGQAEAEARAAARTLNERLAPAQTDLRSVSGDLAQAEEATTHWRSQPEALTQTASGLYAERSDSQSNLAELQAQIEQRDQQSAELMAQIGQRDQRLGELTAKLQQEARVRQALQAEADPLRATLTGLQAERGRLANSLTSVQGQLQQRDQRMARLLNQTEAQAHQDLLHRQALHAAQTEAAQLRASLTGAQAELDSVRAELQAAALQFQPAPTPPPQGGNGHGQGEGHVNGHGVPAAVAAPYETRLFRPAEPQDQPAANGREPTPTPLINASQPAAANRSEGYVGVEFDDQWLGSAGQSCPRLGLMSDPETRHAFASHINRCYAIDGAAPVGLSHQNNYCLSSAHLSCPILTGEIKRPRLPINTEAAGTARRAGLGRRLATYLGRNKDEADQR